MKPSTRSSMVLTLAAALGLSFATVAAAQSDVVRNLYVSAANIPTNVAGVHTYATPREGFNPLTASDEELATYGFPPRPDKQADADHYALWERAMGAAKIRWHGELKPMPASGHGTMPTGSLPQEGMAQVPAGPKQMPNINASGVVLSNTLKTWSNTASFNDIWTVISVPVAQLPFASGSCYSSGATDLTELSFAGIDGRIIFNAATGYPEFIPGEQGGVFTDVNCGAGLTYYNAYVGWESGYSVVFAVNPGDLFYTELHAFGGCNPGSVYVEDLTTLTYNSYSVSNPCLVPQVGRTANWMVGRYCCNGPGIEGAYPLANTIGISFEGAAALNGSGKTFYPGSQATSTTVLTMRDNGNTQNIELVNQGSSGFQGQHSLFFQTTGCAYTGGCAP